MNVPITDSAYAGYSFRLSVGIGLLAVLLIVGGCSSHAVQLQSYNDHYQKQLALMQQMVAAQAAQPHMLDLELHADGRVKRVAVGREIKLPVIPPYRPPIDDTQKIWAAVVGTTVKTAGSLIGIGLVADGLVDLANAAGDRYSGDFRNSFNSAGGDQNVNSPTVGVGNDWTGDFRWQSHNTDNSTSYEPPTDSGPPDDDDPDDPAPDPPEPEPEG